MKWQSWDLIAAADEVVAQFTAENAVGGSEFAKLQEHVAEVQGRCSKLEEELGKVRTT